MIDLRWGYDMKERTMFLLPEDLPDVLEPDTAFEIRIATAHPSEIWLFRVTRQSEVREFFAHKLSTISFAMNTGRAPMLFVVGEIPMVVERRLVFVPAIIIRNAADGRRLLRWSDDDQSIDELIANALDYVDRE